MGMDSRTTNCRRERFADRWLLLRVCGVVRASVMSQKSASKDVGAFPGSNLQSQSS
jgi:hypothetical protein